jgi:multidrug efflux pump subunit AcrB
VTGQALDLSALIVLLTLIMLTGIVVTNAIMLRDLAVVTNAVVLRDLMQHGIEASADVRTVLIQGGRTHMRPILMTGAVTILALIPLALSSGGLIAASLATVVIIRALHQPQCPWAHSVAMALTSPCLVAPSSRPTHSPQRCRQR